MGQKADAQLIYTVDEASAGAAKAALDEHAVPPTPPCASRCCGALPNNGNLGLVRQARSSRRSTRRCSRFRSTSRAARTRRAAGLLLRAREVAPKAEVAPFSRCSPRFAERLRQRKRMMAMSAALVSGEGVPRRLTQARATLVFRYLTRFRVGDQQPWTPRTRPSARRWSRSGNQRPADVRRRARRTAEPQERTSPPPACCPPEIRSVDARPDAHAHRVAGGAPPAFTRSRTSRSG